jgi:hypothetical protein
LGVTPAAATGMSPLPLKSPFDVLIGYEGMHASRKAEKAFDSALRSKINSLQNGSVNNIGGRPLGFAAEEPDWLSPNLLAYSGERRSSKSPAYKAPMLQPASSPVRYAAWGQFFVDGEWRDGNFAGVDIGRDTTTVGGIGGFDAVITGLRTSTDALVVGTLGGAMSAKVKNADGSTGRVEGPFVGFYAAYVMGSFSVDGVFKVDFLDLNRSIAGQVDLNMGMTNYTFAVNLNNKFPLSNGWWVEPTIGFSHTSSSWDATGKGLGYQDGTEIRVQGGARAGTSFQHNGIQLEPTFSAIAYSPVTVDGGSVAVAGVPAAPTDEGKVFGVFTAKLNAVWSRVWSAYVEAELRTASDVFGAGGRFGARYNFNP